jgi:hypothetical protein
MGADEAILQNADIFVWKGRNPGRTGTIGNLRGRSAVAMFSFRSRGLVGVASGYWTLSAKLSSGLISH